ncbi:hypothetical protein ACG7TL_007059 [Trametes sanguinea]
MPRSLEKSPTVKLEGLTARNVGDGGHPSGVYTDFVERGAAAEDAPNPGLVLVTPGRMIPWMWCNSESARRLSPSSDGGFKTREYGSGVPIDV